jgi:hypothetical protein
LVAPQATTTDPALLIEGGRLYVYFAGGRRAGIAADIGVTVGVRVCRLPR